MHNFKCLLIPFYLMTMIMITLVVRGQEFRSVGKEKFRILDTSGFYLYSINKLVQGEKIARPQVLYYFSIDSHSPLMDLTLDNLEKAFASNPKFRYSLETSFQADSQLLIYDKALKMYKIKYLYCQALK